MKLQRQLAINQTMIDSKPCPKCEADAGAKCKDSRGPWDQGIHLKRLLIAIVALVLALPLYAQAPKPPDASPALSASQQIALKELADKEQALQQQWQVIQQQKSQVVMEFGTEHPGYRLNPQSLQVEKAEQPKPAEPKPAEPKK